MISLGHVTSQCTRREIRSKLDLTYTNVSHEILNVIQYLQQKQHKRPERRKNFPQRRALKIICSYMSPEHTTQERVREKAFLYWRY